MFYTYVLYSESFRKTYVGFTSNLEGRLLAHNHPQNKGYTKRFQPWIILYSEEFEFQHEAMVREQQLKTGQGRVFIQSLISAL